MNVELTSASMQMVHSLLCGAAPDPAPPVLLLELEEEGCPAPRAAGASSR
eukprot:CAMPEP_0177453286 /NCGR_PEP_ID=MMETSP0369-20130122/10753_1 /TAXON_ID=447022 ORGANISM="Scrippsiella hangoei-like, Strain SHHI-4" /NCGR_SAMPLE_ID=MMETSP0369 /ASSEMBLY_ACC=CAM_ASM_000364 /LENGTH=49 /DNA_ID= /DNA_START= /DNA_END= /DNA_ORIENTATION=